MSALPMGSSVFPALADLTIILDLLIFIFSDIFDFLKQCDEAPVSPAAHLLFPVCAVPLVFTGSQLSVSS